MKSWDPAMFDDYMEGSLKGLKREGDEGKLPGQMSKDLVDAFQQVQLRFDGTKLTLDQQSLQAMSKRWAFDSRMAESGRTADSLSDNVLSLLEKDKDLIMGLLIKSGAATNIGSSGTQKILDSAESIDQLKMVISRMFIL